MLRSLTVALLLCCALPAAAQNPPPSPTPTKKVDIMDIPLDSATHQKVDIMDLPLDLPRPPPRKANPNDLPLEPAPGFEDLDASTLKGVNLCIFPFIREDKVGTDSSGGENLLRMQKIFLDVARSSPLLKDSTIIGKGAPLCGIEDTACIASLGAFTVCTTVLAGRVTREDNGFTLRARMIDAKKSKLLAKVNQVIATDDEAEMAAWAEGQACRALKVSCKAEVKIDADRPDMKILIDNRAIERKPSLAPGVPETLTMTPGIYKVRATIGQRTSREIVMAVRRKQTDTLYVRQTEDGGIPIMLKSELKPNEVPGPSREFKAGPKVTKIVGVISAGLGVVALGVAGQQALHSKSLANDAQADLTANGGYYQPGQVATATGVASAKNNATIFTAVGAGLIVVGAVLFFAF